MWVVTDRYGNGQVREHCHEFNSKEEAKDYVGFLLTLSGSIGLENIRVKEVINEPG